jgi:hypothetical protein
MPLGLVDCAFPLAGKGEDCSKAPIGKIRIERECVLELRHRGLSHSSEAEGEPQLGASLRQIGVELHGLSCPAVSAFQNRGTQ